MSFQFNFDLDDSEIDNDLPEIYGTSHEESREQNQANLAEEQFKELSIQYLLESLPTKISSSPIRIPLSSGETRFIARRDLFDARFQLISDETGLSEEDAAIKTQAKSALAFIDEPSDLVPWVYEGGLKTWECSLDLVDYLDQHKETDVSVPHGKRILEIGCGTAIPSVYILNELLSSPVQSKETEIHLQDYNASALELITFPNILLAWYMSPASEIFHDVQVSKVEDEKDGNVFPAPDPAVAAEIPITEELKAAFQSSLLEHHVSLRFFSGSWSTFPVEKTGGRYDVVLTSETVYRMESVPSLIHLIYSSCEGVSQVERALDSPPYLCLVAAKVFYFGVGGGITEFIQTVNRTKNSGENKTAEIETVWEKNVGVGRKILRLFWK
ncbi:hypothetical protein L218DRAFT_1000868 [Marasmius fiardii PR-910]|nr:hypothetical protein L218DRAFT_1000868 [Marasmius fiardii PR-910]